MNFNTFLSHPLVIFSIALFLSHGLDFLSHGTSTYSFFQSQRRSFVCAAKPPTNPGNSTSQWAIEFQRVERELKEFRAKLTNHPINLPELEAEAERRVKIVDDIVTQIVKITLGVSYSDARVSFETVCDELQHNMDSKHCLYTLAARYYSFVKSFPTSAPLLHNIRTDPAQFGIKFDNLIRGFVLPLLAADIKEQIKRITSGAGSVSPSVKDLHELWIREMNNYNVLNMD